jgi:hypothetical protein
MKYGITLLLFISYTAHAGPCLSREQQRMPLRYIYVTPTLEDNDQKPIFSGKYAFVHFNNSSTCGSSTSPAWPKPQQDEDVHMVQIKSVVLTDSTNTLSVLYALKRIAPDGTHSTQLEDSLILDVGARNDTLARTVPLQGQNLKFLIEQAMVNQKN